VALSTRGTLWKMCPPHVCTFTFAYFNISCYLFCKH